MFIKTKIASILLPTSIVLGFIYMIFEYFFQTGIMLDILSYASCFLAFAGFVFIIIGDGGQHISVDEKFAREIEEARVEESCWGCYDTKSKKSKGRNKKYSGKKK